jgi:glucosamine--fructose-6-phosphate aminotransferase (isomerizing)
MTDNHLLSEILEQPEALRRVYDAYVARPNGALQEAAELLRKSAPIFMSGMVTSEYGSMQAASLLNRAGKVSVVQNASELLHYHLPAIQPGACLVAVSQSGESAEIVHMLGALDSRVPVIGIYNTEGSFLAEHCDIGLPILSGPQLACGSKTNLSTVAVMLLLATVTLNEDLQAAGQELLDVADSIERFLDGWEAKLDPIADFLEGSPYIAFVGRGPGMVSALFSGCLFREVPKLVAEAMSAASFRHGMNEMLKPEHRLVVFAPAGDTQDMCLRLAQDTHNLGVPVMVIANSDVALEPDDSLFILRTDPHDEYWAPLLDMVPLQLAGYTLAERKEIEPGVLTIATYITAIE